jgi:hypothetical protein
MRLVMKVFLGESLFPPTAFSPAATGRLYVSMVRMIESRELPQGFSPFCSPHDRVSEFFKQEF